MKNEKAIALESNGSNTDLTELTTMKNNTRKQNKIQIDLFTSEQKKNILQTIQCCDCNHTRPLDGYRFGLMPLCSDCRTERSHEILSNQIERREKR